MNLNEAVEKFDKEHGGDCILVKGWLLFSDGAMREVRAGAMYKVPDDPYKAAELTVRYWEAKLQLAVDEFSSTKMNILSTAKGDLQNGYYPPGQEAIELLEGLKEKVQNSQVKLQQAETNLSNSKSPDMLQREKSKIDMFKSHEDFDIAIRDIEV